MSTRSERIKLLIENSNLSYVELEKRTGITKSSLQRYASGTTAKIPLDVIEKLSKAFNVSQEYLMGWSEEKKTENISPEESQLTEGEKMWLTLYHSISDDTRKILINTMQSFERLPDERKEFALQVIRAALGDR